MTALPPHPASWGTVSADLHRCHDHTSVLLLLASGTRHTNLTAIGDDCTRILADLEQRWQAMCDSIPGQPGASDPAATRVAGNTRGDGRDPTRLSRADRDIATIRLATTTARHLTARTKTSTPSDHDIARARRLIDTVARILTNYQPRAADDHQRARSHGGADGCHSCARVSVDKTGPNLKGKGIPKWEPVDRNVRIDDALVPLCRWCRRWWEEGEPRAELPPRKAILARAKGEPITKKQWYDRTRKRAS